MSYCCSPLVGLSLPSIHWTDCSRAVSTCALPPWGSVYSLAKCLHWIRSSINEALNHHGNLPCCPFHGKPGITCSSHPIVRIWQAWFANLLACNLTARVYRKTTPVRFAFSSGMGNPRFRNLCLMGFVCILHAQKQDVCLSRGHTFVMTPACLSTRHYSAGQASDHKILFLS